MALTASVIYFVACHPAPATHFAQFAPALRQQGHKVEILATGTALKKFSDLRVTVREFDPKQIEELAKICSVAQIVITDVGASFMGDLHRALEKEFPHVVHLAYYDNPEREVPGDYPKIAKSVVQNSQGVLFANRKLANEALYPGKPSYGVGYYPLEHAQMIFRRRCEEHRTKRAELLKALQVEDRGQKILVYFGGSGDNKEYVESAFPHFLHTLEGVRALEQPLSFVVLVQQHPRAENKDKEQLDKWKERFPDFPLFISRTNSDEAMVLAEGALYFQTSMNIEFYVARIPTIMQISREPYRDILVRNRLCPSVSSPAEFYEALHAKPVPEKSDEEIEEMVGITPKWPLVLEDALKRALSVSPQPKPSSSLFSLKTLLFGGAALLAGSLLFRKTHTN